MRRCARTGLFGQEPMNLMQEKHGCITGYTTGSIWLSGQLSAAPLSHIDVITLVSVQ